MLGSFNFCKNDGAVSKEDFSKWASISSLYLKNIYMLIKNNDLLKRFRYFIVYTIVTVHKILFLFQIVYHNRLDFGIYNWHIFLSLKYKI